MALPLAASLTQAQSAPPTTEPTARRADPLDAQAPVPPVTYESPMLGYRRLDDDRRIPWKDANQTVNRIGGWRAYAREAQQPDAVGPAPGTKSETGVAPTRVPSRDHPHRH